MKKENALMRILDKNNNVIENPNFELGYLKEEQIFIQHHDAIIGRAEEGHYEVIAEYPETGGKDVEWVVDIEGIASCDAWDEYENILRFIEYTEEEIAETEPTRQAEEAEAHRVENELAQAKSEIEELKN
jgi:hypothetical protein